MALVNRDLVISWGGYIISTANNRLIHGWTYNEDSYEAASVQFEFVVVGATDSAFASECALAEAAFRTPRQALTITQGGVSLLSLSHAANTGFDSIATIVKTGQVGDTGRSRFYKIHIAFGRPADNVGTNGRRTGSIDVSYTPSRQRIITLSGVYTVLTTTARDQYVISIDSYCNSVITGLGISQYELLEEPVTEENDTHKVITFKRVYREIIYPQAGSANDLAIVGDTLMIDVSRNGSENGAGGSSMPYHFANISVIYDCAIDKNVTQDLSSKYTSIKSSILDKIRSGLGVTTIAIIEEAPTYDYTANRISVRMTVAGVVAGTLLLYHQATKTTTESGKVFVPAWTGDALSYYKFQGHSRVLRTTTKYKRQLSAGTTSMGGGAGGGIPVGTSGGGGSVFAGGLFGNGSWIGGSIFSQGDPESSTGLFGQPMLPTSLGNVVGAEGGATGGGADAGGAGGGSGRPVQTLDSHAAATSASGTSAITKPEWEPTYTEHEEVPLFVGLPDGDIINYTDIMDILIEQYIKPIGNTAPSGLVFTIPTNDPTFYTRR